MFWNLWNTNFQNITAPILLATRSKCVSWDSKRKKVSPKNKSSKTKEKKLIKIGDKKFKLGGSAPRPRMLLDWMALSQVRMWQTLPSELAIFTWKIPTLLNRIKNQFSDFYFCIYNLLVGTSSQFPCVSPTKKIVPKWPNS